MVGGKIIEVRRMGDKVRLWCLNTTHSHDEAAIYVEPAADLPAVGDAVWWQGRKAYWTPADRHFVDRPLNRIGYSFKPS